MWKAPPTTPASAATRGARSPATRVSDFDAVPFLTAKGTDGIVTVEGETTRIAYILPESATLIAAERSFAQALEAAGFDITFRCDTEDCGRVAYDLDVLPIPQMSVDPFALQVIAATSRTEDATLHAQTIVSLDGNRRIRVQLNVVRAAAFESKMIDAAQMQSEISLTGRVALYGIYFDTDSAAIKPESAGTLAEIARLLGASPDLDVIIVGHTDNQGGLEYNLDLSQARARSVHDALAAQHGDRRRPDAVRRCRLPRPGRHQRHRRGPRAQPPGGDRGAVTAGARCPPAHCCIAPETGYA